VEITVLTDRADDLLKDMVRREISSLCTMREREVESLQSSTPHRDCGKCHLAWVRFLYEPNSRSELGE